MARRLPVVYNSGQFQQVQSVDTLSLLAQTVINFSTPANSSQFTVAATNVSTAIFIICWIAKRVDSVDNPGDDTDMIAVTAIAGTGNIIFQVSCTDPKQKLYGTFAINYLIG